LRLYLMFLGPLERDKPWNTKGIEGVRRFLDRVWRLFVDDETGALLPSIRDAQPSEDDLRVLHKTIAEVTWMTEDLRFNTAISQMMVFVNEMIQREVRPRAVLETFVLLLAPYAPHLAEELWAKLGHGETLAYEPWPTADETYLVADTMTIVVQVMGKVRDQMDVPADADQDTIIATALAREKIQGWIEGKDVVKKIYVPGKLVNIVAK
jgi:leucyl-tRNA synthetase